MNQQKITEAAHITMEGNTNSKSGSFKLSKNMGKLSKNIGKLSRNMGKTILPVTNKRKQISDKSSAQVWYI